MKTLVTLIVLLGTYAHAADGLLNINCDDNATVTATEATVSLKNKALESILLGEGGKQLPAPKSSCTIQSADSTRPMAVVCTSASGVEEYAKATVVKAMLLNITVMFDGGHAMAFGDKACMIVVNDGSIK